MKTLQAFVDEINTQIPEEFILSKVEEERVFQDYVAMFRNEFNEVPNFDVDNYGRIILLRPEIF